MRREAFESRTIKTAMDIIPIINHLEDNLDGRPITVILKIAPNKKGKSDYCSRKKTGIRKIKIAKPLGIKRLQELLLSSWATNIIHVSIE